MKAKTKTTKAAKDPVIIKVPSKRFKVEIIDTPKPSQPVSASEVQDRHVQFSKWLEANCGKDVSLAFESLGFLQTAVSNGVTPKGATLVTTARGNLNRLLGVKHA